MKRQVNDVATAVGPEPSASWIASADAEREISRTAIVQLTTKDIMAPGMSSNDSMKRSHPPSPSTSARGSISVLHTRVASTNGLSNAHSMSLSTGSPSADSSAASARLPVHIVTPSIINNAASAASLETNAAPNESASVQLVREHQAASLSSQATEQSPLPGSILLPVH